VRQIRNIYQQVQFDEAPENAIPLRHFWLDSKRIDAWFKQRQEAQQAIRQHLQYR